MRVFVVFILGALLALVAVTNGAMEIGRGCPSPHKAGEKWDVKPGCKGCRCSKDGSMYSCATCGSASVEPGYTAVYNLAQPYPDCCNFETVKDEKTVD